MTQGTSPWLCVLPSCPYKKPQCEGLCHLIKSHLVIRDLTSKPQVQRKSGQTSVSSEKETETPEHTSSMSLSARVLQRTKRHCDTVTKGTYMKERDKGHSWAERRYLKPKGMRTSITENTHFSVATPSHATPLLEYQEGDLILKILS